MTVLPDDIDELRDLRDHLARLTKAHKLSSGWTYDDEVALLERVIAALEGEL